MAISHLATSFAVIKALYIFTASYSPPKACPKVIVLLIIPFSFNSYYYRKIFSN